MRSAQAIAAQCPPQPMRLTGVPIQSAACGYVGHGLGHAAERGWALRTAASIAAMMVCGIGSLDVHSHQTLLSRR